MQSPHTQSYRIPGVFWLYKLHMKHVLISRFRLCRGQEEVLLQDLTREGHQRKQGYAKIEGCCQQAVKDNLLWVWVDTCCIDKTSSAELSEAINSMFHWYENSKVCYAYLQDVPSESDIYEKNSAFRKSRWFTRGWTLQELLAPRLIQFYDTNWAIISSTNTRDKKSKNDGKWISLLCDITSIEQDYILHERYRTFSAAHTFSWMSKRNTTRVEDEAYCLLGLLNINMPLLYGEGNKAFIRLQEAILSSSDDISPLAWGYHCRDAPTVSYLAASPKVFPGYPEPPRNPSRRIPKIHTTVTGRGLHIELLMVRLNARNNVWLAFVEEERRRLPGIGIILQQIPGGNGNVFARVSSCPPIPVRMEDLPRRTAWAIRNKQIYIAHDIKYRSITERDPRGTMRERFFPYVQLQSSGFQSRPDMKVGLSFVAETGYSPSSSWPPVFDHFNNPHGPYFYCFGPESNVFYVVFSKEDQDGIAVRVSVRFHHRYWGVKSIETAFCVLGGGNVRTALEHCCGTKLGSKVPQFAKDVQWSHCLAVNNATTGESGHVYAVNELYDEWTYTGCELVWKRGPYVEEGPTSPWRLVTRPEKDAE